VPFLVDVSGVYVSMSLWSRVWCRVVHRPVGAPIACAVCVLSLSAPAIMFWLTCVAMCGCAAPICALCGVCLGCQPVCASRYVVLSVVIFFFQGTQVTMSGVKQHASTHQKVRQENDSVVI
jgi:hypothetical protein